MNHINTFKLFESNNHKKEISKKKIDEFCKEHKIKNYTINSDMSIDVNGSVDLTYADLESIPIKFNKVSGIFDCSYNNLSSLKGCPEIVGTFFSCTSNNLSTLEYGPKEVGEDYDCGQNRIISLIGSPDRILGNFICDNNELITLDHAPKFIGEDFLIRYNKLNNFNNCPEIVGEIYCNDNNIYSLSGCIKMPTEYNNNPIYTLLSFLENDLVKLSVYDIVDRLDEFEVINGNIVDLFKLESLYRFCDVKFDVDRINRMISRSAYITEKPKPLNRDNIKDKKTLIDPFSFRNQ